MTALRIAAVCGLAIILQLSVFTDVRIAGVAPELLALVAVLAGLQAGAERGPTIAFAAGLLWDIYLPTPMGVAAITFALLAYAVSSLEAGLFHDSRFQLVLLAALGTAAAVIGYAFLSELLGQRGLVNLRLLRVAAVSGIMNALLAPLAAPIVRWSLRVGDGRRPRAGTT